MSESTAEVERYNASVCISGTSQGTMPAQLTLFTKTMVATVMEEAGVFMLGNWPLRALLPLPPMLPLPGLGRFL